MEADVEQLGRPFAGSIALHAGLAAIVILTPLAIKRPTLGDERVGGGTVGVNVVKTIPIPARTGQLNRLANDTESVVPQAPAKQKEQRKIEVTDAKAIPIPSTKPEKRPIPQTTSKYAYRPQTYAKNQVYSSTQQALTSPQYGMQGTNGISIGPHTVLGDRFGYYVQLLEDRIAAKWNHADVNSRSGTRVLVTFTILRDGTLRNVQIAQPSGNYVLDLSARRAVFDASPVDPLPPAFDRSEANVEFWFELKQ